MNNDNKRLREILRKEFARNLHTYEILFSHHALKNYYSGRGNVFGLAKEYIKSSSTIGNTKKNKEQAEKEINSFARKLENIISIHYDYFKHCERTEEKKERLKKFCQLILFKLYNCIKELKMRSIILFMGATK